MENSASGTMPLYCGSVYDLTFGVNDRIRAHPRGKAFPKQTMALNRRVMHRTVRASAQVR